MARFRTSAASVCGTLGVIALLVGVLYAYTARSLFNSDVFAARVADGLASPAAAHYVAEQVTDQIIEARRDLLAYRPIILGSVERIVASAPFRTVVRQAVRESHRAIMSSAARDISFSIADAGVIVRSALSMYPQIADKIPADARAVLTTRTDWPNGEYLARIMRAAQRVRLRAVVLVALGLALGGVGLALSGDKRGYLVRNGLALAVSALVVGIVARFGAGAAASIPHSETVSALVRGMWPAFVQPLARRMLVVGALGLVPVAVATSLLGRVNLITLIVAGWRRATLHSERGIVTGLRGAALIVVGGIVALHPGAAMEVFVVLAGAGVFFIGMCELFAALERALPDRAAVARTMGMPVPARVVVAIVVMVVAMAGGVFWFLHDDASAAAPAIASACNGHPELCGRRLDQVAFAATHNAMAAGDIAGWMFPNQEKGIETQLRDGIRGFLVDVHYGVPMAEHVKTVLEDETANMKVYEDALGKEAVDAALRIRARLEGEPTGPQQVYLAHGFCELGARPFVDALEGMREFLVENPGEIVFIVIQDEGVAPQDVAECFEKSGLIRFVYQGAVTPPWPTLGELVAGNQRVLVFAEHDSEGVSWYHPAYEVFQETPYRFLDPSEFSNKPNRGGTGGSLLLMNHWIETTPAPKPSNAEIVNAYDVLYKRAAACRRERNMMPTLVAVDFYRTGDLLRVVDALNGFHTETAAAR